MKKPKHYIHRGPIRAIQFTGDNQDAIEKFLENTDLVSSWSEDKTVLYILPAIVEEEPVSVRVSDFIYQSGNISTVEKEVHFKQNFKLYKPAAQALTAKSPKKNK